MTGEMLCRIRLRGPRPGKKPNSVGDAVAPKRKRLPWRTKLPLVARFRMANGPLVLLPTPTTGWSFHDPRNNTGRLIPVSQSIELEKSPRNVCRTRTLSVGSGVAGLSAWKETTCAPVDRLSFACTEFCQLNPPNRIGVSKLNAVTRWLASSARVSNAPPGSARSRVSASGFLVVLLVKLSPGDQEMSEPRAMGTGESVTAGSSCCTLPSVRLCRRLPPSVRVPQENRLE